MASVRLGHEVLGAWTQVQPDGFFSQVESASTSSQNPRLMHTEPSACKAKLAPSNTSSS